MPQKPHRQIRTSKIVGDPSSQYAYKVTLDEDLADKREVIQWAEDKIYSEMEKLIVNQIKYEKGVMTQQQKWQCVINAATRIKADYNL